MSSSRRAEEARRQSSALRHIDNNLAFTGDETWAWFVLPTQLWAFRSESQREQLMYGFGDALAWLAGHRLHLRITSRPYPTGQWDKRLDELTPRPLEGTPSWSDHIGRHAAPPPQPDDG